MSQKRRVVIESPFKGNAKHSEEEHIEYARQCLLDCLHRGEAPIASHLLFPQVLDDSNFTDRQLGIEAGLAWHSVADAIVVYLDFGVSDGMRAAIQSANNAGLKVEYRRIFSKTA